MADNSQNEQKRILLKQLIESAMGGPNKSLQEVISDVKSALEAYKNFAKEWDNLEGKEIDEVIEGEQDLGMADVSEKENILRQMIEANQVEPPSGPRNLELPGPLPPMREGVAPPLPGVSGPVPLGPDPTEEALIRDRMGILQGGGPPPMPPPMPPRR